MPNSLFRLAIAFFALFHTDKYNMGHTVYVVHAIDGDKGIQVIMDTTTDTFPSIDPEFRKILKSIRK